MSNTKIGNLEAIALVFIIMVSHALINIPSAITLGMGSSAILNTLYIGIIAIIISYIVHLLMKNFPTFDILDISYYLGGNILKNIIGFLFWVYFIFFSSILLRNIIVISQIIYLSNTSLFFINAVFVLGAVFSCTLKYNSIFRANLLLLPMILSAISFVFFANLNNFNFSNIFPILGNGPKETFIFGIQNLFAFQGIGYLYFLPPLLKKPHKTKIIFIWSMILSGIFLLFAISTTLLLFSNSPDTDVLLPLLSAIRYIEFGHFFQRLDPVFLLMGIIAFESFICVVINICSNIFTKVTKINNKKAIVYFISILFFGGLIAKNYSISTYLISTIYKYAFFILTLGISIVILILANIKKKFIRS